VKNKAFIPLAGLLCAIRCAATVVLMMSTTTAAASAAAKPAPPVETPRFANDASGHAPLYYLPVTLTNNQNNGRQQRLSFLRGRESIEY
jgi:hypothetical protein